MIELSLDNIEKAEYKFGGRVTITVTKDACDEYAIEVNDGGVDLRYGCIPAEYHGSSDAIFERSADTPTRRWFVSSGDDYHYINEYGRHTKGVAEFALNCAREGMSRLVEMGYIPKPIELQRDTVNGFDIRGVTVTATPVCGGKYQLRIDTGDIDVSKWGGIEIGERLLHVWPSSDYDDHMFIRAPCGGVDPGVEVPLVNAVAHHGGKVSGTIAVAVIETMRDYVNELHKRGELAVKKVEPVVTKVGEVTFTVVDVGDGEVELTTEVPDPKENYPWFNPMRELIVLPEHKLPTLVPSPFGGSYKLFDGRGFVTGDIPLESEKMSKTEAVEIIKFVKDAYVKYDEAVKKWAPPMNASGKIKNEWVESRKPADVGGNTFSTETGELASDGRFYHPGYYIDSCFYPIYAPSGEYAGYFEGGEFINAPVRD